MTTQMSYVLPPAPSSDEQFVMIGEAVDATLTLYSLVRMDTGELVSSFAAAAGVRDWVLGPQARFLAILESGGRARILDPRSGRVLDQLRHQQDFARLIPVPHDDILVTVDTNGDIYGWQLDGADGAVTVAGNWLIGRTSDAEAVSVAARAEGLAFEPAAGLVATADVRGERNPAYFRVDASSRMATTRISPGGDRVVTDSGPLFRLWRLEGAASSTAPDRDLSAAAIDADGRVALFGFRGGNVRVRSVEELRRAAPADNVDYIGHRGTVTSLAVNAARNMAASGGSDGVVRVWNLATVAPSEHFLRHPEGPIRALTISRAGDIVVSAAEYSARVWDAETGQLVGEIPVDGAALAVALSTDGSFVTVGDTAGNIFFGVPRGEEPRLSARARGAVTALAIAADGSVILSGDAAGTLQLWDAATGTPLRRPYAFDEPLSWVDFGADSATVFARSGSWVHELIVENDALVVVASRFLPIRLGPDAVPAEPSDDSIRWLAGPTQGAMDYLDIPMRGSPSPELGPDSPVLSRDWSAILGLAIDEASGLTGIAR
jgi:WD40 repeat protein